jgi:hypothetical protein
MKIDEKLLLHAIIDNDEDKSLNSFKQWTRMINFDEMEGGSFRLIPLLYKRLSLRQDDFEHKIRMKGIYRYFLYKNNLIIHKSKNMLEALNNHHIPFIVLKGASLLASYYDDRALRPMSDMDILVHKEDVYKAIQVLSDLGWHSKSNKDVALNINSRNAMGFKNDEGFEIDIHWHVIYQCCWDGADKCYWNNTEEAMLTDMKVRILSPTLLLLHTCAHGIRWNEMSAIRWITDACKIIEKRGRDIDWQLLYREAEEKRLVYCLKRAMDILKEEFSVTIPEDFIKLINSVKPSSQEKKLYNELINPSKFSYIKTRWYIYSLGASDKSFFGKIVGLPTYLQKLWNLNSKRQVIKLLISKSRRRFKSGGRFD